MKLELNKYVNLNKPLTLTIDDYELVLDKTVKTVLSVIEYFKKFEQEQDSKKSGVLTIEILQLILGKKQYNDFIAYVEHKITIDELGTLILDIIDYWTQNTLNFTFYEGADDEKKKELKQSI